MTNLFMLKFYVGGWENTFVSVEIHAFLQSINKTALAILGWPLVRNSFDDPILLHFIALMTLPIMEPKPRLCKGCGI